MIEKKDNVILFPKWRKSLENESLQALKQKKYLIALDKLDQLLDYQVSSHEIIIGKLICLMELDRFIEAQDLCEDLLQEKDNNYYEYVHLYLTILFQTNQYGQLMEQVKLELENKGLPDVIREQFQQLYDMSETMADEIKIEQSSEYITELADAIEEKNYIRQWQLIESLRKMKYQPTETITSYLTSEYIHPVIKTVIFKWLKDMNITEKVEVHKLDLQVTLNPIDINGIRSHATFKQILLLINEVEQKNPSLFILLEQLLFRYMYVRYPIVPSTEDAVFIAQALKQIGNSYLHRIVNKEQNEEDNSYIEEIKMCEALYLSVIEE